MRVSAAIPALLTVASVGAYQIVLYENAGFKGRAAAVSSDGKYSLG